MHNECRSRGGPWDLDEIHSSQDGNQAVYFTLAHAIWHCQYHIVWVTKYSHSILTVKKGPGK